MTSILETALFFDIYIQTDLLNRGQRVKLASLF